MCCGKKNNSIKVEKVPSKGRVFSFLTENFLGKVFFILLSFILMWGVPFMLCYILFFGKEKIIENEE